MNPAKYVSFGITGLCFYAIAGILGCGGGGDAPDTAIPNSGTEKPNPVIDYRDYAPFRSSVIRTFNAGTYNSVVITPTVIDVTWGDTTEEFRIRDYAGEPWVMLDAYRDDKKGVRHGIKTTRVEIDYGQGFQPLPNESNPYVPVTITRPFTLRQWGVVAGEVHYFWQHRITPMSGVYNSCWQGLGDSLRPALKQEEVWYDNYQGWIRGTGILKDGVPTGEVTYGFFQMIAKDAGYVWQGSDGLCLVK